MREELHASAVDLLVSGCNELKRTETYKLFNRLKTAAPDGITLNQPPTIVVPAPQSDGYFPLCGIDKMAILVGFGRLGHPTGYVCESLDPTPDDVINGLIAVGCIFPEGTRFALPSPAFCRQYSWKSKSGQCTIVTSEGIVFRAQVDTETRELCIQAFGVPGKDAIFVEDPEKRKELKLDGYHCGPNQISVHHWVAGAFGLSLKSSGGIDHLNRIPSDNRIVNLRSAEKEEQFMNKSNRITYYSP